MSDLEDGANLKIEGDDFMNDGDHDDQAKVKSEDAKREDGNDAQENDKNDRENDEKSQENNSKLSPRPILSHPRTSIRTRRRRRNTQQEVFCRKFGI